MAFKCTSCGACCALVGLAVNSARERVLRGDQSPLTLEVARFPFKIEGLRCENLNPDNSCRIYDTRPDICRVDRMFDLHYSKQMSKKEYYGATEQQCRTLESLLKSKG